MEPLNAGIGRPVDGQENCRAYGIIDCDEDGLWFLRVTCPIHKDYLFLRYYRKHIKKDVIHTTPGIRHWSSDYYNKHLEKH